MQSFMRINKFIAQNTHYARRKADELIKSGQVTVNGRPAVLSMDITAEDTLAIDGRPIKITNPKPATIVCIDKPAGYVCSHNGQGSPTVYDLLPSDQQHLNIAGRLDKDSSGLVVLTDDGELLNELTHPSFNKQKVYEITTNKPLNQEDTVKVLDGVDIGDNRPSRFQQIEKAGPRQYTVTLTEGRNRQIRRTFAALGYKTEALRRIRLGEYHL